jgi:ribosomal protein S18 acetylase RimI-like enzyme
MIRLVRCPDELDAVRGLFREYEADIGVDLCFQNFEAELEALPGDYAPPRGRLFVAEVGNDLAGCVALRPNSETRAEMKRLYVRPAHRGLGLGRELAERVLSEARAAGYAEVVLDTLPSMDRAIAMYRTLGFQPIAPYRANPVCGALYLGLQLAQMPEK